MSERINQADMAGNTDAQMWAKFWLQTYAESPSIATDEGAMIGWFANAIMAGHDAARVEAMLERAGVDTFEEYLDTLNHA